MEAGKTIGITGSAGFIGSHVVDRLIERGDRVIGLDNLAYGRRENFEHHLDNPRFTFHEIDITDKPATIDLLRDLSPDRLIALMSQALDRFDGEPRGILECSKGSLLRYLGRTEEARDHLLGIIQQFCGFEAPPRFARQIISHIDSGEEARVV